jgi:Protein of unknown function (DUF1676)
MEKSRKFLLILSMAVVVSCVSALDDCVHSESPIACRSVNFLTKAFNQVVTNHNEETLSLLPGLEIVQNENANKIHHENDERSINEQHNESFFMRLAKYLQTHDMKIKFSEMVGKTDLQDIVNNVFNNDDPAIVGEK